MKDALAAAYGSEKPIDYYSYEPFQVYGANAVSQMAWVSSVGDLWRTGGDIRAMWRSILANAHANNKWAPNGVPGHYNDADMLEVGNGDLTLAEQRSHFALCKSSHDRAADTNATILYFGFESNTSELPAVLQYNCLSCCHLQGLL